MAFELFKRLRTEAVLKLTRVPFRDVFINAETHEPVRKKRMPLIYFFRRFLIRGSSAEKFLREMINHKATATADFFANTLSRSVNREAVRLLMEANIYIYIAVFWSPNGTDARRQPV